VVTNKRGHKFVVTKLTVLKFVITKACNSHKLP